MAWQMLNIARAKGDSKAKEKIELMIMNWGADASLSAKQWLADALERTGSPRKSHIIYKTKVRGQEAVVVQPDSAFLKKMDDSWDKHPVKQKTMDDFLAEERAVRAGKPPAKQENSSGLPEGSF